MFSKPRITKLVFQILVFQKLPKQYFVHCCQQSNSILGTLDERVRKTTKLPGLCAASLVPAYHIPNNFNISSWNFIFNLGMVSVAFFFSFFSFFLGGGKFKSNISNCGSKLYIQKDLKMIKYPLLYFYLIFNYFSETCNWICK